MAKKLFVGNLAWSTTDEEFAAAFSQFGPVSEAVIIKDKFSGRSKGFGFVTFENDADADKAIAGMDGKDLGGRPIAVNEARPQQPRQ